MPESDEFGEVGYTPPAGRYGTTDDEHNAYMQGHAAGWTHANFTAAYGSGESVSVVAERLAAQRYTPGVRLYLRAYEGFVEGAKAFDNTISGD